MLSQHLEADADALFAAPAELAASAREAGLDEHRALARGPAIVVGTPGRLLDHLERGSIDLSLVRAVVLDEVLGHAQTVLQPLSLAILVGSILVQAARVLDFGEPVAVMLLGVLHCVPDSGDPAAIVARLVDAMPPGSYLTIAHPASDVATGFSMSTSTPASISVSDVVGCG